MTLTRLVLSDLHLANGRKLGEPNPMEDFFHDERFAELLSHYDLEHGQTGGVELILNGDIFDLLKIKIDGVWPLEITEHVAVEKLRPCLEGHPRFVHALKTFLENPENRLTYLPGNHDLEMWFPGAQELFMRYVAPGEAAERVRFITRSDTYYLPEGIQVRHGHQFERIHRVDYDHMTRKRRDGSEILFLPWGTLWILEVLNPLKELRSHIDRIQPLSRFILGSLVFDPRIALTFFWRSTVYFLRHRVFALSAWTDRIRKLPRMVREDLLELGGGYLAHSERALRKVRGVHTLIVGHSHNPRYKQYQDGKVLVNTGTWVKMINLDLKHLGQASGLTYAVIEYEDSGKPRTSLMRWIGRQLPCEQVPYSE
ncbi:MAG: hypothetical protein R3B40_12560 [Polyangiales bacterium]|nr:metallophosphoesterase [Myxococcales bacterium]MCB9661793.1 metallophosphoesterase [Sandaracinaceae bacterium]